MDNIDIQIICALQLHCFLCPVTHFFILFKNK